jgi:isoquinoline 1-oxidoreductase beta subunit
MTTRRDFLKTAAASSAALVIGVRWDGDVFAATKPTAAFAPNVWLRIEATGKTLLTVGKSEMGQGVRTSLPMILADELDADWTKVELVQAQPSADFKRLGTGGSWSVGGSWKPLRQAAAAAREMLVAAAAAQWGVSAADCRTAKGAVTHGSKSLSYGALVERASKLEVPKEPKLKAASEFRLIGTRQKRMDAPSIVNGTAKYGIDARVPGMLFASVERAPTRGAKVRSVDSTAAMQVRGVKRVVRLTNGVAVVADSTWAAMKGRAALKVDWDAGPNAAFNSTQHFEALHRATAQPGIVTRSEGETAATPSGAKVVEATYSYPFAAHAPVEPMNCVAHVHDGKCEIWVPTQAPNRLQTQVAELLKIAPEAVTVHVTLMGGGFGRRLNADYGREAAELSREIQAPVQILWTRADDMRDGHFQAASVHQMSGAVDAGRGIMWRHKKVSSLHNLSGPPTEEDLKNPMEYYQDSSWGVYDIPYAFPSMQTAYVPVDIPIWIGPWRAVYSPGSTFARECFIDELAHAAGKDPLAFRLALLPPDVAATGGDKGAPGTPADVVKAGSLNIDRRKLRRVLRLAAEKSGWGTPLPNGRARGVAANVYDGETHVAFVVELSMTPNGSMPFHVHRVVCAIDCGVVINPLGIEQQVESGVIWSLSNMKSEITFKDGRAEQQNFLDFQVLRMSETPQIETHIVPSNGEQPFGIGEPTVPPLAPAVANAMFAATGKRYRTLPIT